MLLPLSYKNHITDTSKTQCNKHVLAGVLVT